MTQTITFDFSFGFDLPGAKHTYRVILLKCGSQEYVSQVENLNRSEFDGDIDLTPLVYQVTTLADIIKLLSEHFENQDYIYPWYWTMRQVS